MLLMKLLEKKLFDIIVLFVFFEVLLVGFEKGEIFFLEFVLNELFFL